MLYRAFLWIIVITSLQWGCTDRTGSMLLVPVLWPREVWEVIPECLDDDDDDDYDDDYDDDDDVLTLCYTL